jgi:peptide deformylase
MTDKGIAMSTLEVLVYGDPVLRRKSAPIEEITDEIRQLAADMVETMYVEEGVGLAAPQVGRSIRMLVADPLFDEETRPARVFVNPQILESWGEWKFDEGCLSVPGIRADVIRPEAIRLRYQDLDGIEHEEEMHEMWARILQHEIDHLDGKLFVDYLSPIKRSLIMKKLRALAKESKSRVTV